MVRQCWRSVCGSLGRGLTGRVEFKVLLQVGMAEVALLFCENKEEMIYLEYRVLTSASTSTTTS